MHQAGELTIGNRSGKTLDNRTAQNRFATVQTESGWIGLCKIVPEEEDLVLITLNDQVEALAIKGCAEHPGAVSDNKRGISRHEGVDHQAIGDNS